MLNGRYVALVEVDFKCKESQIEIEAAPTIDAVPVVRCKDCKYWNPTHRYCEGIGNWLGEVDSWSDNGFCFKGERRTDDTD